MADAAGGRRSDGDRHCAGGLAAVQRAGRRADPRARGHANGRADRRRGWVPGRAALPNGPGAEQAGRACHQPDRYQGAGDPRPHGNNGPGSLYQHETWDDAGFLGPFITDRQGNIYTAPVPLVSLVDNPPEQQNRIYRVDTDSQVMSLFSELPPALPFSGANPFGVVGLAYDCETDSLYATSLAGSTAGQEVGRIFHVDLKTKQVLAQLEGVDAMGVAAFNSVDGKRLYYAPARHAAEVRSIALDAQGNFVGEPRREFSFANKATGGRRTIRRIRFNTPGEMTLHTMDFNYSLQVPASAKRTCSPIATIRPRMAGRSSRSTRPSE